MRSSIDGKLQIKSFLSSNPGAYVYYTTIYIQMCVFVYIHMHVYVQYKVHISRNLLDQLQYAGNIFYSRPLVRDD